MFKIFLLLGLLLSLPAIWSAEDLPRGTIIKKVVCLENKEHSYALYLPANYSPEKKWPALYAFDPDGEGDLPAGIFQAAAEKYGFIVIGSNNNRNGLGSAIQSEFIKSIWKDSHARLAIDLQRTYAAGFSGGARLANNFAWSCKGCIAGVVSCGAGFPPEFPLDKTLPYAIFGTAGVNDYNYPEMIKLGRSLAKLGIPHHIARFEGVHQWLTGELTFEAIEWFNLQAMKTGRLAKNETFIKDVLARRETEAEKLLTGGQILDAYDKYDSITRDLAGLMDSPGLTEKRERLSNDKNYKAAVKEEDELFNRQTATVRGIITRAGDLLDAGARENAIRAISAELNKLRELADAKADSGQRRFARRALRALLAESNESAMYIYMQKKDYKSAAANFELAALVYPASSYIQFNMARALVLDGRKKEGLEALNRAVEKGFKDCALLGREEAFQALRNEKDFLKLRAAISCTDN